MRYCPSCERELEESAFGVNRAMEDGLSKTCRVCVRAYSQARRIWLNLHKPKRVLKTADIVAYRKEYHAKHRGEQNAARAAWDQRKKKEDPAYFREKFRRAYERKMRRLRGSDWLPAAAPTEAERAKLRSERSKRKYRRRKEKYPERHRAKYAVKNAIKRGKLVAQPCWVCGETKTHGHHPDYGAPLDVVWLCEPHHRQVHDECRAADVFPGARKR